MKRMEIGPPDKGAAHESGEVTTGPESRLVNNGRMLLSAVGGGLAINIVSNDYRWRAVAAAVLVGVVFVWVGWLRRRPGAPIARWSVRLWVIVAVAAAAVSTIGAAQYAAAALGIAVLLTAAMALVSGPPARSWLVVVAAGMGGLTFAVVLTTPQPILRAVLAAAAVLFSAGQILQAMKRQSWMAAASRWLIGAAGVLLLVGGIVESFGGLPAEPPVAPWSAVVNILVFLASVALLVHCDADRFTLSCSRRVS